MQVWSSGPLEARCRSVDVEAWRYGVLEARYRCRDMDVWSPGALETRCKCSEVEILEGWSSRGALQTCRGTERWRRGGVEEVRRRRVDIFT